MATKRITQHSCTDTDLWWVVGKVCRLVITPRPHQPSKFGTTEEYSICHRVIVAKSQKDLHWNIVQSNGNILYIYCNNKTDYLMKDSLLGKRTNQFLRMLILYIYSIKFIKFIHITIHYSPTKVVYEYIQTKAWTSFTGMEDCYTCNPKCLCI